MQSNGEIEISELIPLVREKAPWMEKYFTMQLEHRLRGVTVFILLKRIFEKNATHEAYLLDHKKRDTRVIQKDKILGEKKCNWPNCEQLEALEKDHILPARSLELMDTWKSESFNVQWLCRYHNRLKTNSIGIGMAMIGMEHY